MMKNRHLSKAIAEQKLYEFRNKLINKCHQNEIEVRLSSRFYASSKTCSQCGSIKKDLKLADRTYICPECGAVIDRDLNAAINLEIIKYTRLYSKSKCICVLMASQELTTVDCTRNYE